MSILYHKKKLKQNITANQAFFSNQHI